MIFLIIIYYYYILIHKTLDLTEGVIFSHMTVPALFRSKTMQLLVCFFSLYVQSKPV